MRPVIVIVGALLLCGWAGSAVLAKDTSMASDAIRVIYDKTATGFRFPESVACDHDNRVLYVSQFGSELKPTLKDGKGRISKVSYTGKILEETFLPTAGTTLHKPKGIWVRGDRLWVTDIDVVWVFDLKSRRGRSVALPGIQFANDPTILGDTLYVSDNRGDALYTVEPADFLSAGTEPKVAVAWSGKSINPNGVYPARNGTLLMVGFKSKDEPRGIYAMTPGQAPVSRSDPIGRLDGVFELGDETLLVTDWDSGSLFAWSARSGKQTLATGFTGPADFCAAPDNAALMVAVPDLVKSEVRILRLQRAGAPW